MQFSSIWPIDRNLSGATTLGQSGPESDGNKEVFHIPQSSSITGTSPLDYLVSYAGHSLGGVGSYPSAEKQLVFLQPQSTGQLIHLKNCNKKKRKDSQFLCE